MGCGGQEIVVDAAIDHVHTLGPVRGAHERRLMGADEDVAMREREETKRLLYVALVFTAYAVVVLIAVEHLIVMLPKEQMEERGVRLGELMARHVGGASGISRVALETMRTTYQELPGMSENAE